MWIMIFHFLNWSPEWKNNSGHSTETLVEQIEQAKDGYWEVLYLAGKNYLSIDDDPVGFVTEIFHLNVGV